jgi:iron complex transport system substrate-binding protein
MKYGGAVVGGGLLAGCAGQSESESTPAETSTETPTETTTETQTTTTNDGSYTVEMFPVGEVEFEEVPETWLATFNNASADMAVALGQADGNLSSTLSRLGLWYDHLGIEYDSDHASIWQDGGYDKEAFYQLDADVHLLDPNRFIGEDKFDKADIKEIEENIAPFFGCYVRILGGPWQVEEGYPESAPTMLEIFEKFGQVFQQQQRAQAMLDLHAEVRADVESRLEDVDPVEIGHIGAWGMDEGSFNLNRPTRSGNRNDHYRPLKLVDAFADQHTTESPYSTSIDWEILLEVDPEHIVIDHGIYSTWFDSDAEGAQWEPELFDEKIVQRMENDPIGSELTAVQNGNIHPGANTDQGPIVNLFLIEFTAQQLYPEQFGEFPFEDYPEVPEDNQLFDRQRVADIVNGDL